MAKNQKDLAESLLADDSPGWLTGFLADEDEFDRRALWRLASWGVGSVGAVIIAIMAHQSGIGLRHEQIAAADLASQSRQFQSIARTNENEAKRLASAIETLNGDRDRLFARMTALEQGLDSVTGSINRQSVTQGELPKTSSHNEAALSSPQAMPASSPVPDKAPPSQATALPLPPAPAISPAAITTAAAALTAIASDAPTKSGTSKTGVSKAESSKADLPKADLPKADLSKTDSSKTDSSKTAESLPSASPSPALAQATPAATETVIAKTSAAKPAAAKPSPTDSPSANSSPAKSQPVISASPAVRPATDAAAAPMAILPPAAENSPATKSSEVAEIPAATPDPSGAQKDIDSRGGKDAKIVVASLPAIAETEPASPPPADVPVAHTDFGVDLGSASSIKGLRALWRGVLKSDGKELASLRPIIVLKERTNGLGMQLRLVAGPLVDAAAAAKICAVLSENGRVCETAVFDGQRLALKEDAKKDAGANDPSVTAQKPRSPRTSRHRHSRRTARVEEPIPVPPPPASPPPKPSTFSSFFSR
jgi:hypothetical protein